MSEETVRESRSRQFSTFFISGQLYGIDVMQVQEVTRALPMTRIPLAPSYVYGLINLRGQISTAIGLRELFGLGDKPPSEHMTVVCRIDDVLISFLVDRIGDVMELQSVDYEGVPDTVPDGTRKFIEGVYKIPGSLLSIVDMSKVGAAILKGNSGEA